MKKTILILILTSIYHCTSTKQVGVDESFHSSVKNNRCEESSRFLKEMEIHHKYSEKTESVIGKTFSAIATGSVAVLETTAYVGIGIGVSSLVCMPIMILEGLVHGDGSGTALCFDAVIRGLIDAASIYQINYNNYGSEVENLDDKFKFYRYTKKTWNKTKKYRIEDFDELSIAYRKDTKCYLLRNDENDKVRAIKQIKNLKQNNGVWDFISREEKKEWKKLIKEFELNEEI